MQDPKPFPPSYATETYSPSPLSIVSAETTAWQGLSNDPAKLKIRVQLAAEGDVVDDATIGWPEDREQLEIGTLRLTSVVPDNGAAQRRIVFDPIPRVECIEPSADPLLQPVPTSI